MKKGLLLSVVASTMIFAGGDIAPVEPAAPASADFWGQIGFSADFNDDDDQRFWNAGIGAWDFRDRSFGDEANNAFSATVVLGVEKELGNGFGFGFEVAGWSNFGWDFADNARAFANNPLVQGAVDKTDAEVSQAYLTYTFGNTAIKAGRQALPKAVSPWAWSDRSAGVIDMSYDGIVIANTDLADTTLVGAWIKQVYLNNQFEGDVSDSGLFALAIINKSLANTTISVTGYYVPDNEVLLQSMLDPTSAVPHVAASAATVDDTWSIWASIVSEINGWNVGLQGAYVDGDANFVNSGLSLDATYGIAAKIGSAWGDFDATLVAAYINDGDYSLRGAGSTVGTSAFWGNSFGGFLANGDVAGDDQVIVRVDMGYKLPYGKLYGGIGYVSYGSANAYDDGFGGRIGYAFNVMGVDAKVEYRYATYDGNAGVRDYTKQRIRVEAFYKF